MARVLARLAARLRMDDPGEHPSTKVWSGLPEHEGGEEQGIKGDVHANNA
jgi:hypothetical protein